MKHKQKAASDCYGCGETFELESWDFCEVCSAHRMICETCCDCVQVTIRQRGACVSEFLCEVANEIVEAHLGALGRSAWIKVGDEGSLDFPPDQVSEHYTDEAQDLFDEWSATLRENLVLYFGEVFA